MYNDLKNNFLVLKMPQNAPQSMQIFNFFLGDAPHTPPPPAGGGSPLPHPPHGRLCCPAALALSIGAQAIFKFPPDTFFHFENPALKRNCCIFKLDTCDFLFEECSLPFQSHHSVSSISTAVLNTLTLK